MPSSLQARIEDIRIEPPPTRPVAADPARRFRSVAAGVGSEILISFQPLRWVPKRASWMARIVEFEWNCHFCDEQVRGPFQAFRHRHGIAAEERNGVEGTLVSDEVEFSFPYGLIGTVGGLIVRRELKQSFAYRQKRLPEILSVAARQAARRN